MKTTWQTRKWCTVCWARAVTLGLKNSKQLQPRWKKLMDYILGHFLPLLIANSGQLQITPCWGHLDNRFPKCDALGTPLLQLLASDISMWTNRLEFMAPSPIFIHTPVTKNILQWSILSLRKTWFISLYRSGTLNSNTVNSKFLWNLCQIPIISCLKLTVNSKTVNLK